MYFTLIFKCEKILSIYANYAYVFVIFLSVNYL